MLRAQLERLAEILLEYEELLGPAEREPARYAVGPVVSRAVALLAHRVRPLARRFGLSRGARGTARASARPARSSTPRRTCSRTRSTRSRGSRARRASRCACSPRRARRRRGARLRRGGRDPAEQLRPRLFEPRFTTKAPGRGSGLGLHLARRLMARHGGERVPRRRARSRPPPLGGDRVLHRGRGAAGRGRHDPRHRRRAVTRADCSARSPRPSPLAAAAARLGTPRWPRARGSARAGPGRAARVRRAAPPGAVPLRGPPERAAGHPRPRRRTRAPSSGPRSVRPRSRRQRPARRATTRASRSRSSGMSRAIPSSAPVAVLLLARGAALAARGRRPGAPARLGRRAPHHGRAGAARARARRRSGAARQRATGRSRPSRSPRARGGSTRFGGSPAAASPRATTPPGDHVPRVAIVSAVAHGDARLRGRLGRHPDVGRGRRAGPRRARDADHPPDRRPDVRSARGGARRGRGGPGRRPAGRARGAPGVPAHRPARAGDPAPARGPRAHGRARRPRGEGAGGRLRGRAARRRAPRRRAGVRALARHRRRRPSARRARTRRSGPAARPRRRGAPHHPAPRRAGLPRRPPRRGGRRTARARRGVVRPGRARRRRRAGGRDRAGARRGREPGPGRALARGRRRRPHRRRASAARASSSGGSRRARRCAATRPSSPRAPPALGIAGSRALPLRPGAPASVRFAPRAVVRGDGVREAVLRVSVADRFGNAELGRTGRERAAWPGRRRRGA